MSVPLTRCLEKTANKGPWHVSPDEQDYSGGREDAPSLILTKEMLSRAHDPLTPLSQDKNSLASYMEKYELGTEGVHLRAGQTFDPLSGSFQAVPVEEWYRGPIKKLEEMTHSGEQLNSVHNSCMLCV